MMIENRWWDRYPDRLEYELQAIRNLGIPFERDPKAFNAGILCLRLQTNVEGEPVTLEATYPDLFPYFRVEIAAPGLQLLHHQHPESKYLCLMGRPTHYWDPSDTVADLVQHQLPRVFETARTTDRAKVFGKEQTQAEPFGEYYPYPPSMILVQGDWEIPRDELGGTLLIGLSDEARSAEALIHGAVLEVRSNGGALLARADARLRAIFSHRTFLARWVRVNKPIEIFDAKRFFEHVRASDPGRSRHHEVEWYGSKLQVWGVVFPEEVGHRSAGEGWVFISHATRNRRLLSPNKFLPQKMMSQKEEGHYFVRAGRAGGQDLRLRTPELQPLVKKTVGLFGLGCLGAPTALELARAGIGQLKVVDDDIVDPGTASRWPSGISVAGRKKVEVIQRFVESNYPTTRIVPFDHRIGATRAGRPGEIPGEEILRKIVPGLSLICDTTAEVGVQHFLSDLANEIGVPYVSIVGTFGGWGGKIIRLRPNHTKGCWMCAQHAFSDGSIPNPPSDNEKVLQPLGCGNPTFTGAGFDLADVALNGVRAIVSTLCAGEPGGYPAFDWDIMTIAFRNNDGELIAPLFQTFVLDKHPACPRCNPHGLPIESLAQA